jgi:peptidoglycan/xylan/chitin deacetylase (PgdA/CDA1 family)
MFECDRFDRDIIAITQARSREFGRRSKPDASRSLHVELDAFRKRLERLRSYRSTLIAKRRGLLSVKRLAISVGLSAFARSGLYRLTPNALRGRGVILTLHRVRPWAPETPGYSPNALLEITPDFLDKALSLLRERGFEFVSLAEAVNRLSEPLSARFAALTFDDGYTDFTRYALPILEKHRAPLTLFLSPGFIDGGAQLWWLQLEEALRRLDSVALDSGGRLPTRGPAEKAAAYEAIYWRLRALPEAQLLEACQRLAAAAGVSDNSLREDLFMGWDEVLSVAQRPSVSIGAHSMTHIRLAQWPAEKARDEMARSRAELESRLSRPVSTFCYPVGDPTSAAAREFEMARELGFRIGVTTRPGMLFPEHATQTLALPRVSLNGLWQNRRSLDVLLSGAPFWLWNRGQRLNVA